MQMQMTQRDKKLLSALASVLIIVGFVWYLIMPMLDQRTQLEDEILVAEMDRDEMEMKIARFPSTQKTNEELISTVAEVAADYYDLMTSQEVDRELTNIVLNMGLESVNLNISSMTLATTEAYVRSELARNGELSDSLASLDDSDGTSASSDVQDQIYSYQVTMTVEGTETEYQNLIDLLTNSYPAIHVSSVSFQQGAVKLVLQEDGTTVRDTSSKQLSLGLELYMCDK
jgi:hypothetical protein